MYSAPHKDHSVDAALRHCRSSSALFELVWHEDGSISFRADNGKFIATKKSGHLYANCDAVEDKEEMFVVCALCPSLFELVWHEDGSIFLRAEG